MNENKIKRQVFDYNNSLYNLIKYIYGSAYYYLKEIIYDPDQDSRYNISFKIENASSGQPYTVRHQNFSDKFTFVDFNKISKSKQDEILFNVKEKERPKIYEFDIKQKNKSIDVIINQIKTNYQIDNTLLDNNKVTTPTYNLNLFKDAVDALNNDENLIILKTKSNNKPKPIICDDGSDKKDFINYGDKNLRFKSEYFSNIKDVNGYIYTGKSNNSPCGEVFYFPEPIDIITPFKENKKINNAVLLNEQKLIIKKF